MCACKHNSMSTTTPIYWFMMMIPRGLSKDDTPGFTLPASAFMPFKPHAMTTRPYSRSLFVSLLSLSPHPQTRTAQVTRCADSRRHWRRWCTLAISRVARQHAPNTGNTSALRPRFKTMSEINRRRMTETAVTFALHCTTIFNLCLSGGFQSRSPCRHQLPAQRQPGGRLHKGTAVCATPQHTLALSLKSEATQAPREDARAEHEQQEMANEIHLRCFTDWNLNAGGEFLELGGVCGWNQSSGKGN